MKKLSLLMVLLFFLCTAFAQNLKIENMRKSAKRSSGAIKEGSEVKGYYFFYVSDKVDKKTNEYVLAIHDNNLKLLKEVKFQGDRKYRILEASFNGSDLMFLFYNETEKLLEYQIYGADGKKKSFSYTRELTKKEKAYLALTYLAVSDEEETYKGLYPIEGKGFISNMPSREEKDYTFQVDFFSTEQRKQWTFIPTEGAKKSVGDYLGCVDGTVFFEVLKFGSMMDQKPDSYIIGLDLLTGKKVFENKTDGKFKLYPTSIVSVSGKSYLFGEYFNLNDNLYKDPSKGFAFWAIDGTGKVSAEKYCSWESDMAQYLDVTSKGKVADFGFMYLHNIVQAYDGNIYAIGEGYKKAVSALGVASKVLGGGSSGISSLKVKVTDMIMLQFDRDLTIKSATIYNKNPNSIELQSGSEFMSTQLLGKMIKFNYGGFDYSYTQVNKDATAFSVCYSDFERGKGYRGATFNSISYNEGKITTDKINLKSEANITWVLPAKQGQVLVMDYYRKSKTLEGHFEKLN